MAGQEKRHGLVAHLLVGHLPAVVVIVTRFQQHRQQVAAVVAARAPLLNDAIDGVVQHLPCLLGAPVGRQRQLFHRRTAGQQQPVDSVQALRERLPDLRRFVFHVGVEKRLAHDGQRQPHHLLRHVDLRAVLPAVGGARGVIRHDFGVAAHALAVKRGLHQPPLAQVVVALAGQQPLAQQPLGDLQRAAFAEHAMIGHQQVADHVRVVEQVHVRVVERYVRHIAEGGHLLQEADAVVAKADEELQRIASLGAGWKH